MNNLAHRSRSLAAIVVIDGESRELFESSFAALVAEYQPKDETEMILIERLAVTYWKQARLRRLQEVQTGNPAEFLARYSARMDRTGSRTLKNLQRLQAEKTSIFH